MNFLFFSLLVCYVFGDVYDHKKSSVQMVSHLNYDKNILKTKSTSKTVQIVHFYKPNGYL